MNAVLHRPDRQRQVRAWAIRCFGADETLNLRQRGIRLLEEAAEAAQAVGVPEELALLTLRHVYSKPAGELSQELGGVGIGVLCLAAAAGMDADLCEITEVERVLAKPEEHFRERNAAKNRAGLIADA